MKLLDQVELRLPVRASSWWAAATGALGSGPGEDDEGDAQDLHGREGLVQHEQAENDTDGGLKGHQRAERRV